MKRNLYRSEQIVGNSIFRSAGSTFLFVRCCRWDSNSWSQYFKIGKQWLGRMGGCILYAQRHWIFIAIWMNAKEKNEFCSAIFKCYTFSVLLNELSMYKCFVIAINSSWLLSTKSLWTIRFVSNDFAEIHPKNILFTSAGICHNISNKIRPERALNKSVIKIGKFLVWNHLSKFESAPMGEIKLNSNSFCFSMILWNP